MYRSKDKDFMDDLKDTVLTVTKDQEKEDRKFSLDYLRIHVKVDDLRQQAVKKFPNRTIDFGEGMMAPDVVVVTKDPIQKAEKEKLNVALKKLGVPLETVFYAHLRFVKTKKKQDARKDIFEKLINILSPKLVLAFDKVQMSVKSDVCDTGASIEVLTDKDKKDARKQLALKMKDPIRKILES